MGYLQTKLGYFKVDNIIDLFCYISAILVVFDFNTCSQDTGLRQDWQWKLGALAVTITWLNLLSLIRCRNKKINFSTANLLFYPQESPFLRNLRGNVH